MSSTPRRPRSVLAGSLSLAVAVTGLALLAPPASAAADHLVISEVYGGGGNSGATWRNDYIELYNPTAAPVSVAGWSVQYRSATGTGAGAVTPLSGTVAPGAHYLVQQAAGAGGTTDLPTPDAVGSTAMAAGGGQVWLASTTAALTPPAGDVVGAAGTGPIVDLVGAATNAASYETGRPAAGPANTLALARTLETEDSDDNAADFATAAPDPRSSGGSPPPPPEEFTGTIAEIQGTGATSPHVDDIATTTGVVTASYPTGGLSGFTLQTGGTPDTPGASDAIFVFAPDLEAGDFPAVGSSLQVVGEVSEFNGLTELTAEPAGITALDTPLAPVTAFAGAWSELDTDAEKEAHESELVDPQGPFTVTNSYATGQYGEIGLAAGTTPLVAPTEVRDFQTGHPEEIAAQNAARSITLDDGSSRNFGGAASGEPLSWLTPERSVRVGAPVSFEQDVVLDFRNDSWKLQPRQAVQGAGTEVVTIPDTRTAAPEPVGGDLRIATFNVLNYFPTTGVEYDALPGTTCTYYNDRAGAPVSVNRCNPFGPRGAADEANLARQQAKTVAAITRLGASVVSLEELENSVQFGKDRDVAIGRLVDALNAVEGDGTWAFAPSPAPADLPASSEEDVIRTGFIYRPADVELVGPSVVLRDEVNFDNAREPLAQAFKRTGAPDDEAFGVIVNHFKSKGSAPSNPDDPNADTGQGGWNAKRVQQAEALAAFAETFRTARDVEALFLAGDFNSYSEEDPIQALEARGYTAVESDTPGEETYSYSGLSGSLDHVLANPAALALVTGADVWNINSVEPVAYQYGRYNYNVTDLYAPTPYAASDHDPEIVGLDLAEAPSSVAVADVSGRYGQALQVPVTVTGLAPTGTVEVRDGDRVLGSAELVDGAATISVPAGALRPGTRTLSASYGGDARNEASSATFTAKVSKGRSTLTVSTTPSVIRKNTRGAYLDVEIGVAQASGLAAGDGFVLVTVPDQGIRTVAVRDGRARVPLAPFRTAGLKPVIVAFSGNALLGPTATLRVLSVVNR